MVKIKLLVSADVSFPAAVKAALGMTIREFATKHDVPESAVSGLINGSTPHPQERIRNALATELGVERSWIDEQLADMERASAESAA